MGLSQKREQVVTDGRLTDPIQQVFFPSLSFIPVCTEQIKSRLGFNLTLLLEFASAGKCVQLYIFACSKKH